MILSALLVAVTAAGPRLPERAIGGVFLTRETATDVELTVRFGQDTLKDAPALPSGKALLTLKVPVTLEVPLWLWDGKGRLLSLGTPALTFRFSCENDGGITAQAVGTVKLKKKALPRPLEPVKNAWGVVGFAVAGAAARLPPLEPAPEREDRKTYFVADLDEDGKPDVRLAGSPDDAMNCDEPAKKGQQWSVDLDADKASSARLRCCGP